jgi:hypothetical protein
MLNDETAYWSEAERSRGTALAFVGGLDASEFESYLQQLRPSARPSKEFAQDLAPDLAARLAKLDPRLRASLLARIRAQSQAQGRKKEGPV